MGFEAHIDRIEKTLTKFGGLYEFSDIIDCIEDGEMQMFAEGDSIAITKVADFPRKRVLDIVLAYGNMDELLKLQHRVYDYAKEVGAEMIMAANSRQGWAAQMLDGDGWKMVGVVYIKEL